MDVLLMLMPCVIVSLDEKRAVTPSFPLTLLFALYKFETLPDGPGAVRRHVLEERDP
jgi:hypothetical protein